MTRRSLIAGLAAAPLALATEAALAPSTAQASPIDAGQFTLAVRTDNRDGDAFASVNSALAAKLGGRATFETVVASANRPATHATSVPGVSSAALADAFTWKSGDSDTTEWVPQGITTSADALGNGVYPAGGKRIVLVSWYYDIGAIDKGMRVSFVDYTNKSAPMYRHVLLVEPVLTASGAPSFAPIRKHAGGITWYGNRLYVVDTFYGLRVFDLNEMFEVATGDETLCGLNDADGKYYAYNYQYVLSQSHAYDNTGTYLRYSAVALDRSSTPDSLVVGEYSPDKVDATDPSVTYTDGPFAGNGTTVRTPKLVRWEVDSATRLLKASAAKEAVTVKQAKIQGSACVLGKHYLSVSNGPSSKGYLRTVTPPATTPSAVTGLPVAPEDLSLHAGSASGWSYGADVLWNLTEIEGARYVYAVRTSG
ncbi:hypothetical protein ACIBUY_23680 [Streptomyces sp. NPDC050085]|uniref:hypothetical protein n=1 Tax=Streptomyces sp. NPDC050085 TaxID=3365600 RepID=UPI00379DA795